MDPTARKILSGLRSVEHGVVELLNLRDAGVDADRRRQGVREALHLLRKGGDNSRGIKVDPSRDKLWMFRSGGVCVQTRTVINAIHALEREQAELDAEIIRNRTDQKRLVQQLHDHGGIPSHIGDGWLRAMTTLKDDGNDKEGGEDRLRSSSSPSQLGLEELD